ncbi:MAG: S9 family peptidase [Bacteroidota bacterium]
MNKFFLFFFLITSAVFAQKKEITLDDIWNKGTFRTKGLESFHSMKKGDFYTILNYSKTGVSLDKYSYETLQKTETILSGNDLTGMNYFEDYTFSEDETKIIIGKDTERIFRHSKVGDYYVYDIPTKKLEKISENKIQEPTFSPDGKKVAFAYQNNLYVKDLKTAKTTQITFDGEKNKIINGITDWVYEEEFSFVRAFDWNGTSDRIAFIRFDESEVPEFSMDMYGKELYPDQLVFKYPKAGENNSEVSLHLYDLKSNKSKKVNLGDKQQHYIPRIKWTKESNILSVRTLNRHQNNLNLLFIKADNLHAHLVLNEKDAAYVDINDNLTFLEDNSFIWTSEKDGYNHIYHYDKTGKLKNQVTQGDWEVTSCYGFDKKTNNIFYQSTEDGSINRSIYSINITGKNKKKLNDKIGSNSAAFSNSFNYFINTFSNAEIPTVYTLNDARSGNEIKEIINNKDLLEKLSAYNIPDKEYSTIKTKNGEFNMWMIKPVDFDPNKKYPLLMFQYSGPGSQSVNNRWHHVWRHDYWHMMLAQKDMIIVCVDGRGTGFKGRDFKKVTYKELGKYEIEDQIEAAKELGKLGHIDESKIGIWGWSFGGYMSSLAITKGADVFKSAIAVAPVTSWRFYDSVYTERYMQTPQENPDGYDNNSPLNFAEMVKGDYLIIHGTGDDNVHVQNTMRMVNALVKENKPFEMFLYPDRSHGVYEGKNTRIHLFEKMTKFIENSLGVTGN